MLTFIVCVPLQRYATKTQKNSYRLTSSPTSPLSSRTLYLSFSPSMSLSPYFSIALSLCHTLFRPLSLAFSSLPLYGSVSLTRTHTLPRFLSTFKYLSLNTPSRACCRSIAPFHYFSSLSRPPAVPPCARPLPCTFSPWALTQMWTTPTS